MSEISIKIKIWDRIYPMKVLKEEEEIIRMAAKLLNDKIDIHKKQLNSNDKQDIMSITAFDIILQLLKVEKKVEKMLENANDKLLDLRRMSV